MHRLAFRTVALGLLALLIGVAPAEAHANDAAGTGIVSFADTRPLPSAAGITAMEGSLRQRYCTGAGQHPRTVTLTEALGAARRLVASDSHGRGFAAFSSSPDGRTEAAAIASAAGAVGAGKLSAALAALLRARQLKPKDPIPLIDAASLLTEAGRGNEALALLTAAGRLRLPRTDPFGIGWPAFINADRGAALTVRHQFRLAETALQEALKAAPLLTEADQDLGVAYGCQGQTSRSTRYLVAAVTRQQFAAGDYVDHTTGDPFGQLNPADTLDTSQGEQLTLEQFRVPVTVAQGAAESIFFQSYSEQQVARMSQLNTQASRDQAALFAQLDHKNSATYNRTEQIEQAIGDAGNEPDIAPLLTAATDADTSLQEVLSSLMGPRGCPDGGASHGQLTTRLSAVDAAWRKYATTLYERQTAFAADLSDPAAHNYAIDQAEYQAQATFAHIVNDWALTTSYDNLCAASGAPPDNPITEHRQEPTPGACPTGSVNPSFSVNLLIFSFGVDCETISAEVVLGDGWINGFLGVSKNYRTGGTTIYGGPQVGVKVSAGPFAGGATARGGVYVTFGSDGNVVDVGMRAGSSIGAEVGPTAASISGPDATWSFVSTFSG